MTQPLCIDLFCGLGGWSEGFLAEGYKVVGFDIERHHYGDAKYLAQLVLQDVLTIHGSQFRNAAVIVASPPCQEYSYMAMPWSRAKQIAKALRGQGEFPEGYTGSRTIEQLNALFNACFRIQCEASEAAGHHIPMVVENVKGAQPWVGRAKANFGSFYLWGDVAMVGNRVVCRPEFGKFTKPMKAQKFNPDVNKRDGYGHTRHLTNQRESDGVKQHLSGPEWFDQGAAAFSSKGLSRKAASAQIAKIPFDLARHIAAVYRPSWYNSAQNATLTAHPPQPIESVDLPSSS